MLLDFVQYVGETGAWMLRGAFDPADERSSSARALAPVASARKYWVRIRGTTLQIFEPVNGHWVLVRAVPKPTDAGLEGLLVEWTWRLQGQGPTPGTWWYVAPVTD